MAGFSLPVDHMKTQGLLPIWNIPTGILAGILEYWNDGFRNKYYPDSVLRSVACGGLEAEGQKYFALCLSPSFLRINSVMLKRNAPEPKVTLFPIFIRIIPLLHHSNIPCG